MDNCCPNAPATPVDFVAVHPAPNASAAPADFVAVDPAPIFFLYLQVFTE